MSFFSCILASALTLPSERRIYLSSFGPIIDEIERSERTRASKEGKLYRI
jgi:hypothetical protein